MRAAKLWLAFSLLSGIAATQQISVTPTSGSGMQQTFTVVAPSWAEMVFLYFTGEEVGEDHSPGPCQVSYSKYTNTFAISSSNFYDGVWMPAGTGPAGVVECGLLASSNASAAGGNLVVNFAVRFSPQFHGAKTIWARPDGVGWQNMGSWKIPPVMFGAGYDSIRITTSGNTATFRIQVVNGRERRGAPLIRIASPSNPSDDSCVVSMWGPGFGGMPEVSSSGSCTLTNGSSTLWTWGAQANLWSTYWSYLADEFSLTFTLTASPTFTGFKDVYGKVTTDNGETSGWVTLGSWNIPAVVNSISSTPGTGNGMQQTFAFKYSSSNGAADLSQMYASFNSGAVTDVGACQIYYHRASNLLYLATNSGGGYLTPVALGSAGTLSNSQCSVNPAGASVSTAGNELTLNVPVTFSSSYQGTKNIHLRANNGNGQTSGWVQKGTWNITPISFSSLNPASGAGSTQNFTLTVNDSLGFTDISAVRLFVNTTTVNEGNACQITYYPGQNLFALLDNTATIWTDVPAGSAGSASNNQCTLNGIESTAIGSGNSLAVTFSVTFSSSFTGAKNVYATASNAGTTTGWQPVGAFTVQTVPDFFLTTFRRTVSVAAGGSTQTIFGVGPLGGFTGTVNLSATVSPSGVVTASVIS